MNCSVQPVKFAGPVGVQDMMPDAPTISRLSTREAQLSFAGLPEVRRASGMR